MFRGEHTSWLVRQMDDNSKTPATSELRKLGVLLEDPERLAYFVPFLGAMWHFHKLAFYMAQFANQVRPGGIYDFKAKQSFSVPPCPGRLCPKTITLCGICLFVDVPGNIHFGYLRKVARIRDWLAVATANAVSLLTIQQLEPDDDAEATDIGSDLAKEQLGTSLEQALCAEVRRRHAKLSKRNTRGCNPCDKRY